MSVTTGVPRRLVLLNNTRPASFATGTFVKKADGTGLQTVGGVGFMPAAIILWTVGGTTGDAFRTSAYTSLGFVTRQQSYTIGGAAQDAQNPSNTTGHYASSAFSIVEWAEVQKALAVLVSMSADGFTVNWTTNDANATIIHYLAIGGPGVTAMSTASNLTASTGNKVVANIGFRPDTVLFLSRGSGQQPDVGGVTGTQDFCVGMMDAAGGQFCMGSGLLDNYNGAFARAQRIDRAWILGYPGAGAERLAFVSMDPGGYTVNCTDSFGSTGHIVGMALKGLRVKVGSFDKVTGAQPTSQVVTGVGFKPSAIMLMSWQNVANTVVLTDTQRYGIGAASPFAEHAAAWQYTIGSPHSCDAISSATRAFVKVNNVTPAVDAACDLTSMDADGFTLSWAVNDAVATQVGYLALAPA